MASSMKVAASPLAEEIAIPTSYKFHGLIELSSTKYAYLVKSMIISYLLIADLLC